MKLIIGLGNPDKKYENTRHNVGFIIIDELQKKLGFQEFKFNKKFNSEITEGVINYIILNEVPTDSRGEAEGSQTNIPLNENKTILVKPQTFMNNSGEAVQKIINFYKLDPKNIIVIHDDLDIEIGKYKISTDSSSAGHKGVQSIIDNLGTREFKRIRIGVEKFGGRINRGDISGENFVLHNFEEEEIEKVKKLAGKIEKEVK
ncbi:MAG: aminoacyl-tRNA hydrolase [Patescibacteria group bacterium]|nr:aminoacyl-tRNA hydrolase [Patescibacteria group bacterium]